MAKVKMFTSAYCPYCSAAKALLQSHGVADLGGFQLQPAGVGRHGSVPVPAAVRHRVMGVQAFEAVTDFDGAGHFLGVSTENSHRLVPIVGCQFCDMSRSNAALLSDPKAPNSALHPE